MCTQVSPRLFGIDTWETQPRNELHEYDDITDTVCLDRWGAVATEFAVSALEGRVVKVVLEPMADERGFYRSLFNYLQIDGQGLTADLTRV